MVTVVAIADLHIGSTVGLCPPTVMLDDGGTYHHSPAQAWLWECWTMFWDSVHKQRGGGELWVVWNGDILENLHHATTQLWSMNQVDWFRAASDVFQSVKPATYQFFLRGTEIHDGVAGQLVETCAPENAVLCGENKTWWTLALEVGDALVEFWHHGRVGHLPWTRHNMLARLSSEVLVEYYRSGRRVPDFVLTAHTHTYAETPPDVKPVIISQPAWQLATGYAYRSHPYRRASIGGVVLRWENGKLAHEVSLFKAQEVEPWRPPSRTC